MINHQLSFVLEPTLAKNLFDENKTVSFKLFNTCTIVYHNEEMLDVFYHHKIKLTYQINQQVYEVIPSHIASDIREGKIHRIDVMVSK